MIAANDTTERADLQQRISGTTETDQRIEEMGIMKNRMSKVIYGLLIPAIVALLAVACNASAVWGS